MCHSGEGWVSHAGLGVCHAGVGCVIKGWVCHAGVGCVMQGVDGVGHAGGGVGHAGLGQSGSCRGGVG